MSEVSEVLVTHVIGMLKDVTKDRWHPIIFEYHPPGASDIPRYRSTMHHTEGFATRTEAEARIPELADRIEKQLCGIVFVSIAKDVPWDGLSIPAMTIIVEDGRIIA